jgi:WD40 repeat protein
MLNDKKGKVAIWIGTIPKKAQFNAYLKETYGDEDDESPISAFCADMGDSFYDHDFVFGEWGAKSVSVEKLLSPWRQSHTFLQSALKLAQKARITDGNTVMIAYDHELKPAKWPAKSPVRFLGNLPYSDAPPPLAKQDLADVRGHQAAVSRLCFSPNGKLLATGGYDGTLMAWDVDSGKAIAPPRYAFGDSLPDIYYLAFSSSGKRCVASTLAETCIWDPFPTAEKFSKPIEDLAARAVTPDGKLGLAASIGDIWIYNLDSGKPEKAIHRKIKGNDVALLPSGQILTISEEGQLGLWNAKTGKLQQTIDSPHPTGGDLAASPAGKWAVTYSSEAAVVWNLEKRTCSEPIAIRDLYEVLVPNESVWIVIPRRKPLEHRSLGSGKLVRSFGPKSGCRRVYAAAGRVLTVDGDMANVELWDLKIGKSLGRFPDQKKVRGEQLIDAAAISPDGQSIAFGQRSGQVQILRTENGKLIPVRK